MRLSMQCALLLAFMIGDVLANPFPKARNLEVYVPTPGGLRPQSSVHFVPPGARVHHSSGSVDIISQNGEILHTTPTSKNFQPSVISPRAALATGYVAYSYWTGSPDSNPIANFTSTWTVPANPKTGTDQVVYLFNALTPASGDGILQPVLQYGTTGAGGGSYWAIAAWYLVGNSTYHSTLVPVQPGNLINGTMSMTKMVTNATITTYTYNAQFIHSPYATITVSTTEVLNWAWEALEIYAAESKSDVPTGITTFGNITMFALNGQKPALTWSTKNDTTDGFHAAVVVDGPTNGKVNIMYS